MYFQIVGDGISERLRQIRIIIETFLIGISLIISFSLYCKIKIKINN
jgi:hypothetical protein